MKGFELILKSKKMILREYWWSFIAFWLVWIAFIGVDAFIALKFSSALIQLSLNVVIDGIVGLLVLRFCLWLLKTLGYKHLGKRTVIIIFFVAIAGGICNGILYMSSAKLVTSMHLFSEDNNKSFLNWGDKYNFFIDTNEKGRLEDWRRNFPEGFFSVFSFILFYYLLEYRRKSNQLEQNQSRLERELSFLEEEKIKAEEELAIRSSQLKPHWMLNMLQNIKILIKRSPDRSIEMIEDLQELTRYMVYEYAESQKKVNLAKEINFLKSYTNLVKKVHGEIIDFKEHKYNPNLEIAPMILIIFMENAIKHGEHKDFPIVCEIKEQNGWLDFLVKNKIALYSDSYDTNLAVPPAKEYSGIGIKLTRKRLKEIYPNNKYALSIESKEGFYSVHLKLLLI